MLKKSLNTGAFIDLSIISFKIMIAAYIYGRHLLTPIEDLKNVYANVLLPFMIYAAINIIRLLNRKILQLLYAEAAVNAIFTIYFGTNHMFFLLGSIISFITLFHSNKRFKIKGNHPHNQT